MNENAYIQSARRTISFELKAIEGLFDQLGSSFIKACDLMMACKGRIIVTGMGKSGHIGKKISATLASTGNPAFFVHPGEASHGDMGMITDQDILLALSHSGSTPELVSLLPLIKRINIPLISIGANQKSVLAQAALAHLNTGVTQEACPLNLAPTASTTTTLVLGDALALALLEAKGFSREDFAFSHPGGALGRSLLLKVKDIMHSQERFPFVLSGTPLRDALVLITRQGMGVTAVIKDDKLIGIFTDGDLRRAFDKEVNLQKVLIDDVMTKGGKTVNTETLAAEALRLMQQWKINALIVTDEQDRPVGALNMHDLLTAGVL